jgi:ferredoxin
MPRLLTLSRAARLVGTSRVALQLKIRSGELPSFDGMVSADDLLRLYPDMKLEEDGGFEQVMQIKERAFGRRVRERLLPSQEILSQRLYEQSTELADLRAHLQRYHAMMEALRGRIREQEAQPGMAALGAFLDGQLAEILGAAEAPNALSVMDDMLRVMSAHVTLHPSRHEFFAEGADTLLEAALKAGLAVNYGCSNGNCGLCKARVVSGQVKKVRPHDYVLSEAEKNQGYTLLCSHAAVGDLVLEALETGSAGDIPQQQIVARIKANEALGEDVRLLHLQTPRNNRLRFLAGQSATLTAGETRPSCPSPAAPATTATCISTSCATRRTTSPGRCSTCCGPAIRSRSSDRGAISCCARTRRGRSCSSPRRPASRRPRASSSMPCRSIGPNCCTSTGTRAPGRALPRQPVPLLGRRARQFPLHGHGRRAARSDSSRAWRGTMPTSPPSTSIWPARKPSWTASQRPSRSRVFPPRSSASPRHKFRWRRHQRVLLAGAEGSP